MSFSCFNTFQNAALFSKPVSFFFPISKGPFTSLFSNGYLDSVAISDGSITDKNTPLAGWSILNGTGTSFYVGSGTTSLYTGGPLPGVSNKYVISVNGDPSGGAQSTGNVQTMTQNYKFPSAGTYNLVFYVFAGAVIDPSGTHSVSVYVGGQPVLYNYSVGNVPNSAPQIVTMPFSVDASNLTQTVGFVFYCANANRSYLGITGMTYFSQTTTPYSFLASDPSGFGIYLPLQVDYQNYAAGSAATSVSTSGTTVVMNGGGSVVKYVDVSGSSSTLGKGLGYLSLVATSQQYLALSGNPLTLPLWSSTVATGFSLAGWFYGVGSSQANNATLFSLTGSNGLCMNLRYFQQNPLLIFTADPARVVCGVPTYNIFPNTWNHVAVVVGASIASPSVLASKVPYRFYLNGVLMTTAYGPWPNGEYTTQTVGYDDGQGVVGSAGGGYFNGYMQDLRAYTRALSANDVKVLATLPVNTTNSSIVDINSMVMYYPMDRGSVLYSYGTLTSASITNGALASSGGGTVVTGWTKVVATGIPYGSPTLLGKSSIAGIYLYGLPSGTMTFVQATNPPGSSIQLIQNVSNLLGSLSSNGIKHVLGFYLFPSDGAYDTTQTVTVSLGSQILLSQIGLTKSASTVPYTYFLLPVSLLNAVGQYPLTFTFSQGTAGSGNSSMCLANVTLQAVQAQVQSGSGYGATNPTSLALYYPLDPGSVTIGGGGGVYLQNYATGQGVQDGSMGSTGGGAATMITDISGASGQIGSGCVALNATNNQYVVLGSFVPPAASVGAGMSFSGWFQSTGTVQANNATLFSLANAAGTYRIQCFYNGTNNWLDFSANPGTEYVAWSYRLVPGAWNFFTYVIQSNNLAGTNVTHTYYLNDVCMNSVTVTGTTWPSPASPFTNNWLGYGPVGGGGGGLGYFNGYMDDFRAYTRALTQQDVLALWMYGYNNINPVSPGMSATAGALIDPSALQIYYPFNPATILTRFGPSVSVSSVFSEVYTGLSFVGMTVNFIGPNTYYYVSVARNTNVVVGVLSKLPMGVASYDSSGMTADTSYTFTIVPYGENDVSYVPVTTLPISPVAQVISFVYTSITSIQISLSYQDGHSYRYVTVTPLVNGVNGNPVKQPFNSTSYTDPATSFSPLNKYNYTLVPYNAIDVSGALLTTPFVSPRPSVTFASYVLGTTTIQVNVNDASTFYYVTIAQNINTVPGSTSKLGTGVITNTYSGLSAYNTYNYQIVPYNVLDNSGTVLSTTATSPVPDVSFVGFVDVSFTRLSVTFASTYTAVQTARSFYDISMARTVNSAVAPASSAYTIMPALSDASYLDTAVTANNYYNYFMIPYNAVNVSGGVVGTTSVSPVASLTFGSIIPATTSIQLNYSDLTKYSYVNITQAINGTAGTTLVTNLRDVSYTSVGLSPANYYSYSLVPYNVLNVSGGLVSTTSVSPIASVVLGSIIPTTTAIQLNYSDLTKYLYVNIVQAINGTAGTTLVTNLRDVSYTSVGLSPANYYSYSVIPYNAINVSGGVVGTGSVSPVASVTFGGTTFTNTTIKLNYSDLTKYSYVNITQAVNGGTDASLVTNLRDVSYTSVGLSPANYYSYSLVPYNALNSTGTAYATSSVSPNADVSFLSYSGITTSAIKINYGSISGGYTSYYDVSLSRAVGQGTSPGLNGRVGILDVSYTDTTLSPNTLYSWNLLSYNRLYQAGGSATSRTISTLPTLGNGSNIAIASSVGNPRIAVVNDGSFATFDVSRTGLGVLKCGVLASASVYVDTSAVVNAHYAYFITPYNANVAADPSAGLTVAVAYQLLPVVNGYFTAPALATDTSSANPASINGWSVSQVSNMNYYVCNGRAGYAGTLPTYYTGLLYTTSGSTAVANPTNIFLTSTTQYFLAAPTGTGKLVLSQVTGVPAAGNYYLSFYAFPGGVVDPSHTLTVSLDGRVLLYNYSFVSGAAGITRPFNLPFTAVDGNLSFTVSFAFSAGGSIGGSIGIVGVGCYSTASGVTLDPSGLIAYYPLNTDASNYSTSLAVSDSGLVGSAAIVSGYLSLSSSNSYMTFLPGSGVPVPAWSASAGFTLSGWFYSTMSTPINNATLISLKSAGGGDSMTLKYNQTNQSIVFVTSLALNGGAGNVTCGVGNNNVYSNMWNHVAVVVSAGTSPTSAMFRLYINGLLLVTVYGGWPAGSYTNNSIGYDGGGSAYYNGYVDDVRVYGRALSAIEVAGLSTSAASTATVVYGLIDPGGMVMYYPFDSGSYVAVYGVISTIDVANPNFASGTSGWTSTGGALTTGSGYSYTLPTGITSYMTMAVGIGGVAVLNQNITYLTSLVSAQYVLSFYAFPGDGAYSAGNTLSVSIGNQVLLNQVGLDVSSMTVPYTTFLLPFSFIGGGTYPLTFTFRGASSGSGQSVIGVTGIAISAVSNWTGRQAVDVSGLALYYPLSGGGIANYASSSEGQADSALYGGASVSSSVGSSVGSSALSLVAANNQYMTMGSFAGGFGSNSVVGSGISFSGWFYGVGAAQASNAVLYSLSNGSGAQFSCVYNTLYGCLNFVSNASFGQVADYTAWSYRLIPDVWYFLTHVIQTVNVLGTVYVSHTYYLNGNRINQVTMDTGSWTWPSTSFSTNTLGTSVAGGSWTGYLDDFRVYRRALSVPDITSLWTYGVRSGTVTANVVSTGGLIDPSGLQVYYPFDQGTGVIRFAPSVTVSTVYGTVFTGITTGGVTVNYGPATAYYYVKTTRSGAGTVAQPVGATTSGSTYTTGLTADTSYTFTITPHNELGVPETTNAVTTIPFSPTSVVTFGSYTLGLTMITLNYSGMNRYVTIAQSVNGGGLGTATAATVGATSYSYNGSSVASAYNYYNFRIIPYNAVDISGTLVDTVATSPTPEVAFGGYSDISFTQLSVKFNSTYTVTATARSYYDVSMARTINTISTPALSAYTIMPAISDTSYIDTTVTANNYYNYFIIPYNALYVSGTMVGGMPVSPTASVTFGGYTLGKTTVQLTYGSSTSLSYVTVEQSTNGGTNYATGINPGTGVLTYTYTGLSPSVAYTYRVTPYNAIAYAGTAVTTTTTSPVPDVSFLSFSGVTTTGFRMNYGSISGAYVSYSYVSTQRSISGVAGVATNRGVGDVSLVETALSPNTLYSYALVPYNAVAVAGTATTSWNIYTLPVISSVVPSLNASTKIALTLPGDTSYSFYDVSRSDGGTGTATLVAKAPVSTSTYIDTTTIVTNTHYTYYVTPYTVSYVSNPSLGASYGAGATVSVGYMIQPVTNGYFTLPDTASGTVSALNPVVAGWTVLSTSSTSTSSSSSTVTYYIGDGAVAGYYTNGSGLPAYYTGYVPNVVRSVAAQYLLLGSSSSTTSAVSTSQTITVPSAGIYYLTWYAFAGASKDAGHSLSVSIGGVNAMYGILKGSSATNTVPVSYTLPWLATVGNLSVSLGFATTTTSTATSYIGLTGITCFSMATNSLGLTVVDPSAMTVYCPLNTDVYEYSTGSVVTTVTGGSVGAIVPSSAMGLAALPVGQGCLTLNGTSHNLTLPTVTLSAGTPGLTVALWFYGSGTSQTSNATLISLESAVAVYYNGATANLAIKVFGSTVGVMSKAMVPNTWNHVAVTVASGGTVVVYVNGLAQTMSTAVGAYTWTAGSYTNHVVGYSTWTSAYTPGYFKGYVSDVRAYTRLLSSVEVGALWNFGEANVAHSMIDPVGMVMYYPNNHGTLG